MFAARTKSRPKRSSYIINRDVNSNCSTVIIAILLNWFSALVHVFHTDIYCSIYKIVMYGLLCILSHSLQISKDIAVVFQYWYDFKYPNHGIIGVHRPPP